MTSENNYNCGGMTGINYSAPGAQDFINSWADEFASWVVDYVKLDGVGEEDIGDVEAWSAALKQAGRPIHLELSNSLDIANTATWAEYSNGGRTGGDIECYCGSAGSSYPLTDWSNVQSRFAQVADWQPDGGPGAFNDYDSIEAGNGPADDGITDAETQSQLSLWAMAASPLAGSSATSTSRCSPRKSRTAT
jgi:alpha-galactosidase